MSPSPRATSKRKTSDISPPNSVNKSHHSSNSNSSNKIPPTKRTSPSKKRQRTKTFSIPLHKDGIDIQLLRPWLIESSSTSSPRLTSNLQRDDDSLSFDSTFSNADSRSNTLTSSLSSRMYKNFNISYNKKKAEDRF